MHNRPFTFCVNVSDNEVNVESSVVFVKSEHVLSQLSAFLKHWELFSPESSLLEIFGASLLVQELLQSGQLILDERWFLVFAFQLWCLFANTYSCTLYEARTDIFPFCLPCIYLIKEANTDLDILLIIVLFRGLRCSWDGLALLDSILPVLLVELDRHVFPKPAN